MLCIISTSYDPSRTRDATCNAGTAGAHGRAQKGKAVLFSGGRTRDSGDQCLPTSLWHGAVIVMRCAASTVGPTKESLGRCAAWR